jgi:photosystem II stability/assembly factor-like uncharacterized protein
MARRLIPILVILLLSCSAPPPRVIPERHDSPDAAAAYHASKRAGTDDVHRAYRRAAETMRRMPRHSTVDGPGFAIASNGTRPYQAWEFLGPGNIGGRTRTLIIDPVDPQVMYAGGVSGGVWKSTVGGLTWEPIGDSLANIAVNSMAMHPVDRNVIYAGTGEGYFREEQRGTALPLRGDGIFVTRDAGETWTQLASTTNENFHYVNDLVISTHEPSRVYAATRTGVWRSDDAGTSWSRVLPVTVKGGCLDVAWRGDTDGDYLFASCGTFEQATVYRNQNAESNPVWEPVLTDPLMGRTSLAIAPSDPSVVYALSATNEPGKFYQALHSVWRSNRNGDPGSWTAPTTGKSTHDPVGRNMLTNMTSVDTKDLCIDGTTGSYVTMGWFCNVIAVDPADPERVWVGGVDLFRSDDGGRTWGAASYWWTERFPFYPYVHADQHAIVFHPRYDGTTNRTVYFANDGGITRTDDSHAETTRGLDVICQEPGSKFTFTRLNHNFGITQFYHGAVFPDGRRFIGGAQDNGTLIGSSDTGVNHWKEVVGGDGGYAAIDPANPLNVYASAQFGQMRRSRDGGQRFLPFMSEVLGRDNFLFIAPFTLDPNAPANAWLGGTRVWRSVFDAVQRASAPVPNGGRISAIAVAPGMSNRVVAGTNAGHIIRSDAALSTNQNTEWAAALPREGFVSSLTFDPFDANTIFATYAGFGGAHVWASNDAGATWTPRDGSGNGALPDIPVHSLAVDPTNRERLYLGTDLGVFVSLDRGNTWFVENSGFANVVTEKVLIAPGASGPAVYAFTHGRGAWRAELGEGAGPRRRAVRH